ncbi:MAG: ADP-ribose pyrophosphatase [Blastocatellia bacterium]|jgi:ADP-ribose pyrophosphatase|nr:ADP-ribose pyrophosphatase [Blastocatellia bacterium]
MGQAQMEAPKILSSKEVFHGKVFRVTDDAVLEGEKAYQREVVRHGGSAAILPVFEDGTVALVRQYRHPTVKFLLEVCAGTLDDRERPEEAAARELEEEIGLVAGKMEKLSEFFVSPGYCEEKMWLFLATDLTETAQNLEEDEAVEVVRLPLSRALEMITDGEIEDAKTIIGLMLAAPRFGPTMMEPEYPAV